MTSTNLTNRRTVLKQFGTGIAAASIVPGSVVAGGGRGRSGTYGNGNGLGAFLNEEAMWKESPVWDTGVADKTGEPEADVLFGGMTDVLHPDEDGNIVEIQGPWNIEPRAVKVSPGTDVTWTWYDGPGAIHAHHLVSYFDPPYEDDFPNPFAGDPHEHPGGDEEFLVHEDLGDSFTYTFEEVGIYLYFCFPHGTPYEVNLAPPEQPAFLVENLFGQRGAVIVADD